MEIKELVIKSINQTLSLKEEMVLKDWISQSNKNREIYNKWQTIYTLDAMQQEYNSVRRKKILNNILQIINQDKKRRLIHNWIVSASIAAVTMFALFLIRDTSNENPLQDRQNLIVAEEMVVIDTIFDAKQIIAFMSKKVNNPYDSYSNNHKEIKNVNQTTIRVIENTIIVPEKNIYTIVLSDSTKVYINGGSRLTYPSVFNDSIREVQLVGEAFFEVTSDKSRSFVVNTKNMKSVVYGTKINVEAYANSNFTATTLFSGKVSVNGIKIVPGKRAVKYNGSERVNVSDVDLRKIDSWMRNEFYYYKTRLDEIINNLAQWYNVDIFFEDESIKTELFTLIYSRNKSLIEVLDLLSSTNKVKFKNFGNEIYVEKLK